MALYLGKNKIAGNGAVAASTPSQEITFTVRNITNPCTALRGMSWREWINSSYCNADDGWALQTSTITYKSGSYTLAYADNNNVMPWDIISAGEYYESK